MNHFESTQEGCLKEAIFKGGSEGDNRQEKGKGGKGEKLGKAGQHHLEKRHTG